MMLNKSEKAVKPLKKLNSNDKFDYNEVIDLQSITGYFKDVPKKYKHLIKSTDLIELSDDVKHTLIALFILKSFCEGTYSEWQIIAKKAYDWLKKQGVTNAEEIILKLK